MTRTLVTCFRMLRYRLSNSRRSLILAACSAICLLLLIGTRSIPNNGRYDFSSVFAGDNSMVADVFGNLDKTLKRQLPKDVIHLPLTVLDRPPGVWAADADTDHHRATRGPSDIRVAIVVPFIEAHVERLAGQIRRWRSSTGQGENAAFSACHLEDRGTPASSLPSFTIVWYYNFDVSPAVETRLKQMFVKELGPVANCFRGGQRTISAKLLPVQDQHPCGTCYMFYKLFEMLPNDFDYFMLLEPDVTAVRSGWLDAMGDEIVTAERNPANRFWVRGSVPHCHSVYGRIADRLDYHVNGNSLYALREPGFHEYLARVRAFYPGGIDGCGPGCANGFEFEGGFDHSIYRFQLHPRNFDYVKNVKQYFQVTPTILNLCEDYYEHAAFTRKYPYTFLVHSKGPFFDKHTRELHEAYKNILGMYTDYARQKQVLPLLASGRMRMSTMHLELCSLPTYTEQRAFSSPAAECDALCKSSSEYRDKFPKVCELVDQKERWSSFEPEKVYVWSSDFHAAPFACNDELYQSAGAVTHYEVDFGNCIYFDACKKRLKVLSFDDWRGFSLDPCPNLMRRRFFEAYQPDPEFQRVDLFICSHPAANCELYMPFNRTLVVYATTRLEFGRFDEVVDWRRKDINRFSPFRWAEWVDNLRRIAAVPGNVVAANNRYDQAYIKYFTGIDAEYIPSWCGDHVYRLDSGRRAEADRQPLFTKPEVILGPYRDNLGRPVRSEEEAWKHPMMQGLVVANEEAGSPFVFKRMAEMYQTYSYADLTDHRAIVFIPYQLSVMSFFEYYRLNIPIFAPSLDLLVEWDDKYDLSWERIYGFPPVTLRELIENRTTVQPPAAAATPTVGPKEKENVIEKLKNRGKASALLDDANDNPYINIDASVPYPNKQESIRHWGQYADIYQFPHVQLFDSWADLVAKLRTVDLEAVSAKMRAYNLAERERLVRVWRRIFKTALQGRAPGTRKIPESMDAALTDIYGAYPLGPDPPIPGRDCKYA